MDAAAQIIARTEAQWDFTDPLPQPKGRWQNCGVCNAIHSRLLVRYASYSKKPTRTRTSWRCDVFMKCINCGHVWSHGLMLSQKVWEGHQPNANGVPLDYWTARRPSRSPAE